MTTTAARLPDDVVEIAATIEARGAIYKVYVDGGGKFCTPVGDLVVVGDTLADLRRGVMTKSKSAKLELSVPVVDLVSGKLPVRGTIVGRHGGTQNVMVRWDGEKGAVQLGTGRDWGNTHHYVDGHITDEELAEYRQLDAVWKAAREARDAWLKKWSIRPTEIVRAAVARAEAPD
jgi:hypothetical protein